MAKRDFMGELARQVEDQKNGRTDHIENIMDFTSSHQIQDEEVDYAIPEPEEVPVPKKAEPVQTPRAARPAPRPVPSEPSPAPAQRGPDSFHEEARQKIEKPARKLKPAAVIVGMLLLALIGVAVYFLVFAPSIVVKDFVGGNISDVSSWAKQNKMETTAIARKEEYSLDYDKDMVIEQSIEAGTKIKPSTPFTVTVSLGADPNEYVEFPSDLKSMTLSELKEWSSENKLAKTKITTQYSTTIPEGNVISYELKNASESEFTRGSTLNIVCSKGQAPTGQVTIENFVGKTFVEMTTWANNKKVVLHKEEAYSDTVASGVIISVDQKTGDAVPEGTTINVVVSKGNGVKIPNLVGYTKEQLEAWRAGKNNNVTVVTKSIYNAAPAGSVIGQNIPAGSVVDAGEVLELTISLYLPIVETNSREWLGKDYLQLKAWVDDVNSKGAFIQAGQYGEYQWNTCSNEYPTPGQIIDYGCLYGTSDLADGCGRPLNLDSRIAYKVSTGACEVTPPTPVEKQIILNHDNMTSLSAIQTFCQANGLGYHIAPEAEDLGGAKVKVEITNPNITVLDTDSFPYVLNSSSYVVIHWAQVGSAESSSDSDSASTTSAGDDKS